MNALQTLAQAAGIAYAAGLNLYATVGIIGLGYAGLPMAAKTCVENYFLKVKSLPTGFSLIPVRLI